MEHWSDFLFTQPSFLEGWARIWDFGNTLNEYNNAPSSEIADGLAIYMDWAAVGYCLRDVMVEYAKENEKESTFSH